MNNYQVIWPRVRLALRSAVRNWIFDPNVTLIDFGWRERDGKLAENKYCIRIHVVEKIAPGPALEAAVYEGITRGSIPQSIGGFPVDVPQAAYNLHQWRWGNWGRRPANPRAERKAPMQGGISIANAGLRGAGTLGGPVIDRETGARMILSNWHVLVGYWHIRSGSPIYQPGRGDGGQLNDTVARLSHHAMASNFDAAVARLTGDRLLINDQYGLGPVKGVSWAQPGMEVIKSGLKTRVTYGRISGLEGTIKMNYRGINRLIQNVMTIEPHHRSVVSDRGDSGSFWLEEKSMNVVGLHFAGSNNPERALAIDMQPILDTLNVDIDTT